MKTIFSKQYILNNKGCYNKEQVEQIPFDEKEGITLKQLFEYLPIKDFNWFLCSGCRLTKLQIQLFALENATFVLPFYEKRYPNDKRVRDCVEYIKFFLEGNGDTDTLSIKRNDADAAAYAAADAAAYAASAAAADAAADAAAAAYAAAYAAAAAAYAAAYAAADAAAYAAADAAAYAAAADDAYAAAAAAYAASADADAVAAAAYAADAYKEMIRVFVFETLNS